MQLHALGLTGVMGLVLALVLMHLARQEALALALVASQKSQRRSGQLAAFFGFGEVISAFVLYCILVYDNPYYNPFPVVFRSTECIHYLPPIHLR